MLIYIGRNGYARLKNFYILDTYSNRHKGTCGTFKSWNHYRVGTNIDQRSALCVSRFPRSRRRPSTVYFLRVHRPISIFFINLRPRRRGTHTKRGRAERQRNNVSQRETRVCFRGTKSRCDCRAFFSSDLRQRENAVGHFVGDTWIITNRWTVTHQSMRRYRWYRRHCWRRRHCWHRLSSCRRASLAPFTLAINYDLVRYVMSINATRYSTVTLYDTPLCESAVIARQSARYLNNDANLRKKLKVCKWRTLWIQLF